MNTGSDGGQSLHTLLCTNMFSNVYLKPNMRLLESELIKSSSTTSKAKFFLVEKFILCVPHKMRTVNSVSQRLHKTCNTLMFIMNKKNEEETESVLIWTPGCCVKTHLKHKI